ncbi:MAG: hypothetical protein ACXAC7_24555, partial [Candidatus Hodarchaeales archaeon]
VITSTEERTSPRYGSRTPRYIQLELGHLLENIRLEAWSREVALHTWLQPVNSPNWSQWLPNNAIVESLVAIGRPDLKPEISNPQMKLINGEFHPILNKINYQSSYSVERAIYLRTSKREYTNRLLYKAEVSSLLWLVIGAKSLIGEDNFPKINSEMLIEVHLVSGSQVQDLTPGIYQYLVNSTTISTVQLNDYLDSLQTAGLNQPWIGAAAFNIVISLKSPLVSTQRLGYIEAGIMGQRLYHSCLLLDLGMKYVRSKVQLKGNVFHYSLSALAIFLILVHISLVFGYNYLRNWKNTDNIWKFLKGILIPPTLIPEYTETIGMVLARVSLWLLLVTILIMLPISFIQNNINFSIRSKLHYSFYLTSILTIYFHSSLNAFLLSRFQMEFILLVIIGLGIWVLLHYKEKINLSDIFTNYTSKD